MQTDSGMQILGRQQERGGSEIYAGARAEVTPSPLTLALSSMFGRMGARVMSAMVPNEPARQFFAHRLTVLAELIKRSLPSGVPHPILVDMGVGFSPMSILMAESLPNAKIIEIDHPEVLRERQRRLARVHGYRPPANLLTLSVDMKKTALHDVLAPYPPHALDFTGAFYTIPDLLSVTRYLRLLLAENGTLLCYLPWRDGLRQVREAARFFRKQVGDAPATQHQESDVHDLYQQAGFRRVEVVYPSRVGVELGLPPLLDVEVLAVAHR